MLKAITSNFSECKDFLNIFIFRGRELQNGHCVTESTGVSVNAGVLFECPLCSCFTDNLWIAVDF